MLRLDDEVLAVELLHDRRLAGLALVELAPGVLGSDTAPARRRPAVAPGRAWGGDPAQVVAHLRSVPPVVGVRPAS